MVNQLRRVLFALVLISATLAGSLFAHPVARSAAQQPVDTVLVEALVGQISKLNPLLATYNPVDRDITSLIFEGLTDTNDYGEIVPDLAKSWTITADGLSYIVELRDDVLWQDGVPFTAADVVFTYALVSDPLFPGAASLTEFWRTVEVDQLGDYLVRFRLTQPLASFLDQLRLGIVPQHALEGVIVSELGTHPFNLAPVGTGPYQIEALTAADGQVDGIRLRLAPVYQQRPEGQDGYGLERVVFRTFGAPEDALQAYLDGEINSIGQVPPSQQAIVRSAPGLSLYTGIEPEIGTLIYNWQSDPVRYFRNPRVRLALAHSIDRAALVNEFLSTVAIPADSPLLPTSWAYTPGLQWPAYDLEAARQLIETANLTFGEVPVEEPTETPDDTEAPADSEAPAADASAEGDSADSAEETPADTDGEESGEDAEDAEPAPEPLRRDFAILTVNDPALEALAQGIAVGWNQLGFEVSVESVSPSELVDRLDVGEFDAAIVDLSFAPYADPDPYVFWHQGQYPDGQNFGGMNDLRISEALENGRREPYGINRVAFYDRFQAVFAERALALPLYYPLYTYAATSQLQGVQLGFLSTESDRFRNIQDWYFAAPEG